MCGIFGWYEAKNIDPFARGVLAGTLAAYNEERGSHSHGFWSPGVVPQKALGEITRGPMPSIMARIDTAIGHTRYATRGAIAVTNSHPFTTLDVTGCHNGSIWNAPALDVDYPGRSFSVDSEHLIAHIAEGRNLEELTGYGTVVYTRTDSRNVWLGTFCGGELAVARIRHSGYAWSSSENHLKSALRMAGLQYKVKRLQESKLYVLADGKLHETSTRLTVKEQVRAPIFRPTEATALAKNRDLDPYASMDTWDVNYDDGEPLAVDRYLEGDRKVRSIERRKSWKQ